MVENFPGLNKDRYVHSSNSISLTFLGEPPIINTYLTLWGNKPVKTDICKLPFSFSVRHGQQQRMVRILKQSNRRCGF